MRKYLALLGCFISVLVCHSQEGRSLPVQVAGIPEELKKEADAVYRLDEAVLDIVSPSEYVLRVHQVVTLLNAEAAAYLRHQLAHDKFYKVEEVEISVLNALGLPVKKYGRKDFETEALFDGYSLVTDDKVMKLYTPPPGFPCTLDIRYKIHATGYIELPNWYINYHKTATELFRYEVTVPASLDIRQRTLNFTITPRIETTANKKHYTWEAKNIPARKLESEGYEPALYLPQVEVSPNEFSYDGYKGNFRSWQDFGTWNYNLYEETKPFSSHRIAEIQALVAGAKNREEKISILYRYLQKNMRYVSIQLGIGGFKPFAVKFVDEKKYGDCKALTNYMRYLLQTVGILSYPALINAGYNKIPADPGFPAQVFNHVILCVPSAKDTTWLECTSTDNKAGELGAFTENKKALLLTEKGGILINTPQSDYRKNAVTTKNTVTVYPDGGALIQNRIQCSGEAASFYHYVGQLKEDEQKELLVKNLLYKNPDELVVKLSGEKETAGFVVNRSYEKLYDFKSGNKYFFPLCVNRLATATLKPYKRETAYLFPYPYVKTDTTVFQLPAGFAPEVLPENKSVKTEKSYYQRVCHFDKEKNQFIVISELAIQQHVIPAGQYAKLVAFFREITALEEENLVLVASPGQPF